MNLDKLQQKWKKEISEGDYPFADIIIHLKQDSLKRNEIFAIRSRFNNLLKDNSFGVIVYADFQNERNSNSIITLFTRIKEMVDFINMFKV